MRRGKHAPKSIRIDRTNPPRDVSRFKVHATCQVCTKNDRVCGRKATFTGTSMRPTTPPYPKHKIDLCTAHAQEMRDLYGYHIELKQGNYELLA